MIKYAMIFFLMIEGHPETFRAFYTEEFSSKESCEASIQIREQQEPFLSLSAEHQGLRVECWEIEE